MEKLIRGVIYCDENLEEKKEEMFERLDERVATDRDIELFNDHVQALSDVTGIDIEKTKAYFSNMESISALTRFNTNTGITHNLIIPKEALSVGLVNELESVDLGRHLLEEYPSYFINHTLPYTSDDVQKSYEVTPAEFIGGEIEEILQKVIDKNYADKNVIVVLPHRDMKVS